MNHASEMRRCLESADVVGARRLWARVSPHLPQPKSDAEALVMLHHARTQAASMALKLRAWSHRWLLDNGYPSGLPDNLKPRAERIYPRTAKTVGISVNFRSEFLRPAKKEIENAMSMAVLEAFDDGKEDDSEFIKARMQEARGNTQRKLFGKMI